MCPVLFVNKEIFGLNFVQDSILQYANACKFFKVLSNLYPFMYLLKSYVPLSVNPHVLQEFECLYR